MLDLIPSRVTSTVPLLDHRYRRATPPCSRADEQVQEDGQAGQDGQPRWLDRSRRSTKPSVSVVIPTLNESRNLPYAMWRLPDFVTEVIVVDGRSSDDTALS